MLSRVCECQALYLAKLFDDARHAPGDTATEGLRRLLTAIGKYWVCKRAPAVAMECMEAFGGNGYIEEWRMPRLVRQSPLNGIWEGSGNVIALDILRTFAKEPEAVHALVQWLSNRQHETSIRPAIDRALRALKGLQTASEPQAVARGAAESIAIAVQACLLMEFGNPDVAKLFVQLRCDQRGGLAFGSWDTSVDLEAAARIVHRQTV